MKKLLLVLAILTALCSFAYAETDSDYVKAKGVLVVGITDFKPMDYKNEKGEWIGFDADLAKAFAQSLGVKVEFQEIEWNNKILELDGKNIDCVWNGMTLTPEVKSSMSTSNPYCNNAQIVLVPADKATQYDNLEALKNLSFAVEHGSAGNEQAKANNLKCVEVQDQASALMEVASGTADGAIIDSLMAAAMVGKGTGYENLTYTVALNSEEYGVGFRKGSDLTFLLNAFFEAGYSDGSIAKLAETYGIQAALIKQ
ncbi:MAG: transporter substrate-binding domain-containing protein [Synergistaceae bacterium]|nr:transporter substrate-binding domain-containing protein [Synergistaceae bacterium]